jgi:adenosylhomocysteine nucleosidase
MIVFALESEAQGLFDSFNVVYCGVGKVNAAYRFTRRLAQWQHERGSLPKLVLNMGSAGSTVFNAGQVVNCTKFVQRDFDVTALGHEAYVTPYEGIPAALEHGIRYEGFAEGICGTGDNFVTDASVHPWNLVDMEAFALAKICHFEKIPFGCLKYITDGADGHAATSWEAGLADTAKSLKEALTQISR